MERTGKFLTLAVGLAAALYALLWVIGAMSFSPWLGLFLLIVAGGAAAIILSMVQDRANDPEDRHYSDNVDQ